jgi:gluconate:H+ symporter, GntP family
MLSPIILIFLCIVVAVVLMSRFKVNTFLVLFGMSVVLGLCAGFSTDDTIKTVKAGFGHTLEKIGLLIIFGVILGEILHRTHATRSIANYIIDKLGKGRTDVAIIVIGFLVGLPIFCDSGFIILSGLLFYLRSSTNHLGLTLCLAGGLYAVHCLVPPHPGITAAASQLSVDFGTTMLLGTALAIPATVVAFFWASYANKKWGQSLPISFSETSTETLSDSLPAFWKSFLPIWLPISLMALKAVWPLLIDSPSVVVGFIGEPVIALLIGVLVAFPLLSNLSNSIVNTICEEAFQKSGPILAIIAAGGMFGEVVKKILTDNPSTTEQLLSNPSWGLLLPFLLTFLFKTAQGSSTVAIMSAAAIMGPMLPSLGLDSAMEKQLALLAMGAGSMAFSHTNDAYFWVVTRFSQIPTQLSLKTYIPLSLLMSLTTLLTLLIISWFVG